ncbi:MAG: hypothetical protein WBE79_16330 [Candidatus Cybelea sp.]
MMTLRQGIFRFLARGTGLVLLATIAAACSGGSTTPTTAVNGITPSSLGSPAAKLTYKFRTINNVADLTFNQLLGISRSKQIVGYYGSGAAGHPNKGYRVSPPFKERNFTAENFPRSKQTQVTAINNLDDTAGFWVDRKQVNHGFIHWNGQFSTYTWPGSSVTQILGLNNSGQAVGFYTQSATNFGFQLDRVTKQFTPIAPPGASNVTATSINNAGEVVGFYTSGSETIGFVKVGSGYTNLSYPGSTITMPFGINNHGDIAGSYVDTSGATHGFLMNAATSSWSSFDDPNGVGTTTINGLNDRRDMVGFYTDSSGNTDGMLMVLVPVRH